MDADQLTARLCVLKVRRNQAREQCDKHWNSGKVYESIGRKQEAQEALKQYRFELQRMKNYTEEIHEVYKRIDKLLLIFSIPKPQQTVVIDPPTQETKVERTEGQEQFEEDIVPEQEQEQSQEGLIPENIRMVMEYTKCSRKQAIRLLRQDHPAEAIAKLCKQ